MDLNLAEAFGWIIAELARHRPVEESMHALIDQCAVACPHPDWELFRRLPYAELDPLRAWLERPFREEPSAVPLHGLWFGLFNPCPDGRNAVADLYVCGSERFDPDPSDNEWAVGPDWWPEARYAESTLLAEIYRRAYRVARQDRCSPESLGNAAEYPLVLGYGAFAVRELLAQVEPSLLLGRTDSVGVAVGFDSGDFVLLGRIVPDGLAPLA